MDCKGVSQIVDTRLIRRNITTHDPSMPTEPFEAMLYIVDFDWLTILCREEIRTALSSPTRRQEILAQQLVDIATERYEPRFVELCVSDRDNTGIQINFTTFELHCFTQAHSSPIEEQQQSSERSRVHYTRTPTLADRCGIQEPV